MLALAWEVTYMGGLILLVSYFLHLFAYRKGWDDENDEVKAPESGQEGQPLGWKGFIASPVVKKWLQFGGGYYGTVAFIELLFIEFQQLKEFVESWQGTEQFSDNFGLGFLISLFVEQFINFGIAMSWPARYLREYTIFQCAAFVLITYALYELSKSLAKKKANQQDVVFPH